MGSYTNFCCRSGGSNLNAGTRTGNTTVPAAAHDLEYASGNWVASTGVFTVASGNPSAAGVVAGDFASVYANGSTQTGFVGRVTSVSTTTITVSLSAKAGTAPTDGTGNRTLRIGGAWAGPSGAVAFPFGFIQNTLTNSSSNIPRINFCNDQTYSITAAMTHGNTGNTIWEGFSSAYGDGGMATIDGGTSGASYVLLTVSNVNQVLKNFIFQNNGATGSASGLVISNNRSRAIRVLARNVRGNGLEVYEAVGCEAYACNQSNTSLKAGIFATHAFDCISHHNTGSNSHGFMTGTASTKFVNCIADSNGSHGFRNDTFESLVEHCDAYNNTGSGFHLTGHSVFKNCNFVKNGIWGIANASTLMAQCFNCGFGSGTQANTSGNFQTAANVEDVGTITYPANQTPWVAPQTGDFRVTLAQAKQTGANLFLQLQPGYSGTVGYPDVGASQAIASGGGAFVFGG